MGNQEFHSASDLHDAAPHAGIVRLFYLPQSKWAVNFEVLQVEVAADPASGSDGRRLLLEWNAARRAHDEVGEGVALAKMQAIGQAFVEKQPLAGDLVEPDEVRAAVVGGWQSPGLKVTVRDDGTLSATLGAEPPMAGRWEVDPSGRVAASVPGVAEQVDASVIGGRLTLVIVDKPCVSNASRTECRFPVARGRCSGRMTRNPLDPSPLQRTGGRPAIGSVTKTPEPIN